MAELDHFSYGALTPGLAYAMSVLGSLLGLSFTARARSASTTTRRMWHLLFAAWAIGGTGIWVMHFVAMLGFGVVGTELRYDASLTTASAVIAVVVVAVGLFIAGLGRIQPLKIIAGGLVAGLGVASMHYTGMAAMRFDGRLEYDPWLVMASVIIAVVAATVALWFTVIVRRTAAIVASALLMGVAVTGMHYTGMAAMQVHLHHSATPVGGSPVMTLLRPILILVLLVSVALIYVLVAGPTAAEEVADAALTARIAAWQPGPAGGQFDGVDSLAAASRRSPPQPLRQTVPRVAPRRRL